MESIVCHETTGTDEDKEMDQKCRIHVHSRRRRLADPDGISAKAAIDGLRLGGLLIDDSAKYVKSVTFSQELSERDETIIGLLFE
jgi:hypothetical protein